MEDMGRSGEVEVSGCSGNERVHDGSDRINESTLIHGRLSTKCPNLIRKLRPMTAISISYL